MNRWRNVTAIAALASLLVAGAAETAAAQGESLASRTEASLLGGLQVLNQNDTALPDHIVNVPLVAAVGLRLTPVVSVEGEFTWMIPVQQSVDNGGTSQDLKSPDILAYQANVRGNWPLSTYWSPYLVGGLGAVTFLSNTDADRIPQVSESQTMFALNLGAGVDYTLNGRWSLRADFREFVAFPADGASGLSDASGADPIWMERGTIGLAYRF